MNGLKVFSASKVQERNLLGEAVTKWLEENPHLVVYEKQAMQSSDSEFHCVTILLWYTDNPKEEYRRPAPTTMPGPLGRRT